jgi:hypothetical protein
VSAAPRFLTPFLANASEKVEVFAWVYPPHAPAPEVRLEVSNDDAGDRVVVSLTPAEAREAAAHLIAAAEAAEKAA